MGGMSGREGPAFSFEEENCLTSRTALEVLVDQGIATEGGLAAGIAALPDCRFEVHDNVGPSKATAVFDVAHNPAALARLFQTTTRRFPNVPLRVVLGLSSKKDAAKCVAELQKCSLHSLHLVTDDHNQKAAGVETLEDAARAAGLEVKSDGSCSVELALASYLLSVFQVEELVEGGDVEATVRTAVDIAGRKGEVVVVCGSFMIMHEAKSGMCIPTLERDPIHLR